MRADLRRLLPATALAWLVAAVSARAQTSQWAMQPPAASTIAPAVDGLFNTLLVLTFVIAGGVCVLILAFCFHYRRGHKANRKNPPSEGLPLEVTWTVIPTILATGSFVWGARVYFDEYKTPPDAMTIYVVGKQWMWKAQHPEGRRENNELHVPIGRPVQLVLTSQDVIHDFYVPAFRIKQDAIPGRYTTEWFTATKTGRYHFFCAQYCGTEHSKMAGWVTVMTPTDYAKWLATGSPGPTMISEGENLFVQNGCSGCHGPASTVHAPSLVGIYNRPVPLQDGKFTVADDRYLHDSILLPGAQIAAGYANVMPSYRGRLTEAQILSLVTYIRSLGNQPMDSLRPPTPVNPAVSNGQSSGATEETTTAARNAGAGAVPAASGASARALRPNQYTELRDRRTEAIHKRGSE